MTALAIGAETSPRRRERRGGMVVAGRAYLAVCFVFLLLPIVTLIVFSFQRNQYASIPGQGWSLRWYEKLLSDGSLLDALKNSLVVSPLAATGASIVGFFAAYAVHRFRFPRPHASDAADHDADARAGRSSSASASSVC